LALGMFVIGDVMYSSLDYAITKETRTESFGKTVLHGALHGYYAFNQCMSMLNYEVYSGQSGNSNWDLSVGVSFGEEGMGIGVMANYNYKHTFDNGTYVNLGVSAGSDFNRSGGPSLIKSQQYVGGGAAYGNDNFHFGLSSTAYLSGSTSQRTGGINIGGKDWDINYENDGGPPFDFTHLGDGGDRYRTAALRFSYKEYSLGFNLMTEAPEIDGEGQRVVMEQVVDGKRTRDHHYKTTPDYRLGGLYIGHGNNYIGFNSDGVRKTIQNDVIHNAVNSPHFINSPYGVHPYGGYWPKRQYSLW
jgi:hypothetical protein